MIKAVDDVMYEVKKSGKNNVIHREMMSDLLFRSLPQKVPQTTPLPTS